MRGHNVVGPPAGRNGRVCEGAGALDGVETTFGNKFRRAVTSGRTEITPRPPRDVDRRDTARELQILGFGNWLYGRPAGQWIRGVGVEKKLNRYNGKSVFAGQHCPHGANTLGDLGGCKLF